MSHVVALVACVAALVACVAALVSYVSALVAEVGAQVAHVVALVTQELTPGTTTRNSQQTFMPKRIRFLVLNWAPKLGTQKTGFSDPTRRNQQWKRGGRF